MERTADFVARVSSPAETAVVAQAVARLLEQNDVLVLGGELGAGKTTFTKALGTALGIEEPITSPTFTLAQQYEGGRLILHHLDVYRLEQVDEAIDLALPELFESEGAVVIEWGDTIASALPAAYLLLRFAFGKGDNDREISFDAIGPSWMKRIPALRSALADKTIDMQEA